MSENSWWKRGIIYQVYPRSFYDKSGDGIGDIPGITEKLDYLQWLGADALWLSPVNTSPMYDYGYDISDYCDIDPLYGTMKDFDRLIKEAGRRGIRIIMDLVINHTSHLHQWFQESRSSVDSEKRDWYIWKKGREGGPPNNWKSSFGGSAWEYDRHTDEYYLHSFLREQPDLNWRNRELREEVFKMVDFWLKKGVDGFRLDVVNWYVKDDKFRDNPSLFKFMKGNRNKYDRNRAESHDIVKELRALLDLYEDRVAVGEVFCLPPGDPALSASYLGDGTDELHMAFDFSLMYRFWGARRYYRVLKKWYNLIPGQGWPCNVTSNHDQPRGRSRYMGEEGSDARARLAAVLLLTLPGTPFIYYGEELGMKNGNLPRKDIVDPLGKRYWPVYKGRDSARTPMLWDASENAGFSKATPWLPVNSDYEKINAEVQKNDRYSILNTYKKLIEIRKKHSALHLGKWKPEIRGFHNVLAYYRKSEKETIFVVLNFSSGERKISVSNRGQWRVLFSTHRTSSEHLTDLRMTLFPYESTVIKKIGTL